MKNRTTIFVVQNAFFNHSFYAKILYTSSSISKQEAKIKVVWILFTLSS